MRDAPVSDNPFVKPITGVHAVHPKRNPDGSGQVVILERIEPGVVPDYCVHGKVTCYWCDEWCWLGSETYEAVISGDAAPMCRECGAKHIPDDGVKWIGRLDDHRS
jgi:hypothetical protein